MGTKVYKIADISKENTSKFEKKKRWAHVKFFSFNLAKRMVDECPTSPLLKQYKNTVYCKWFLDLNGEGFSDNGKMLASVTSHYCKNRACPICNRIRTAHLYNGYKKPLSELQNPYFVTLTAPNVGADELKPRIKEYYSAFHKILKRHSRSEHPFKGIRKFECTINEETMDFHPHLHVIIEGKENAYALRDEWLQAFPDATIEAQDVQKVTKAKFENALLELFKYFAKFFSKEYKKDKSGHYVKDKRGRKIPVLTKEGKMKIHLPNIQMLDKMLQAMSGLRVFQPFGNIRKIKEDFTDEDLHKELIEVEDIDPDRTCQYEYDYRLYDWVDKSTGELFSEYTPPKSATEVFAPKSGG